MNQKLITLRNSAFKVYKCAASLVSLPTNEALGQTTGIPALKQEMVALILEAEAELVELGILVNNL